MIIQSILIQWTKETRGEPYASVRSHHPNHFPLPSAIVQQSEKLADGQLLWHRLSLGQTMQGVELLQEQYEWLTMPEQGTALEGELPGIKWKEVAGKLHVNACYHPSFGKPVRTNGQSDLLDEKAFELTPLQYGQIVINGRHTIEDGSIYEQRITNLWYVTDYSGIRSLRSSPDYQYKQIASLW
ncbi:hypothetical protein L2089_16340 [Paenibacillus hunanensis]|uniref:hypothetical protein n=1 Tax=Paenibacillus hunanensis TaxID=539262 RepID=UPI00202745D3|nr:hypothetical protein [Paenibacillus hunanensis]MCL9662266.1 hypothetical protein [Paenibacillus hunanensis]